MSERETLLSSGGRHTKVAPDDVELGRRVSINEDDDTRTFRLIMAAGAAHGHAEVVRLIRKGYDVNACDYDKRTPLHIAASKGHLETVVELLNTPGINVNPEDSFGQTPLDEAARNGFKAIVAHLKEKGATYAKEYANKLLELAAENKLKEMQELVELGQAHVDDVGLGGRTALHVAVQKGHVEIAKFLLEKGARVDKKDDLGFTALDEVSRHKIRTGHNPMTDLLGKMEFDARSKHDHRHSPYSSFFFCFTAAEIIIIVLFFVFSSYDPEQTAGSPFVTPGWQARRENEEHPQDYGDINATAHAGGESGANVVHDLYPFFQDVNVMIFIGFGFLMTFLRKHAFNSLGLTFLVAAFVLQWHLLVGTFCHQIFQNTHHALNISLHNMLLADFCAGAVLITYGVLLGRVSPMQLLSIAIFEVIFFAINENIGLILEISDIGGTIVIHMFGAFFGLACAMGMKEKDPPSSGANVSVYHSDVFAMIGTIFLWMYWPSFNAAPAKDATQQQRAILNTFLSLTGSCVTTFLASNFLHREKKFFMVDIQNATLAGGVAIGNAADMLLTPGACILVGSVAGLLSVIGYRDIQPWLNKRLGLEDTCGVNNLHGMPSIIGALVGIIATASIPTVNYESAQLAIQYIAIFEGRRDAGTQAWFQVLFVVITIAIASVTGFVTGFIVKNSFFDPIHRENRFLDEQHWEVPLAEIPYYYDERGEISRDAEQAQAESNNLEMENKLRELQKSLAALQIKSQAVANPVAPAPAPAPQQYLPPPIYVLPTAPPTTDNTKLEELLTKLVSQISANERQQQKHE